jgi:hypothetical protein
MAQTEGDTMREKIRFTSPKPLTPDEVSDYGDGRMFLALDAVRVTPWVQTTPGVWTCEAEVTP